LSLLREDKLDRIAALKPSRKPAPLEAPARGTQVSPGTDSLAELLGAVVGRNRYGEHLVVRQWFSSPEPCAPAAGTLRLLFSDQAGHTAAARERLADPAEWLFLDTETTGLAGGTGTYAFLVGIAWWEAGGLQVEQLFMRDYGEEHSLLLELSRRLAERRLLITFNGKSFDWPLLETRYLMTRAIAPRPPSAHLDLLHPARQLWRPRLGSVRLAELERHVLGPARLGWDRRDDIDSAFIPQVYFDFLRGGPPERLASVFRHNQMDLRGLAALAGRIITLLSAPGAAEDPESDARDIYGLSRLFCRRGEPARARVLYERALSAGLPTPLARAARRELALLAKRERDFERANALWEEQLDCLPGGVRGRGPGLLSQPVGVQHTVPLQPSSPAIEPDNTVDATLEAYEQLAIHYEHRAQQPQRAAELTRAALAQLRRALRDLQTRPGYSSVIEARRGRRWQARLEHRLARLQRSAKSSDSPPLLAPGSSEPRQRARESNKRR